MVLSQDSNMDVTGVEFIQNTATYAGGVVFVNTGSYFDIDSSSFLSNYANSSSVIEVLGSSQTEELTINKCRFERNEAIESSISFMYARSNITRSYFTRNKAEERTKNIFMGFSTIDIEDTTFRSTPVASPAEYVMNEETLGAFLFIILDVWLDIKRTRFLDGTAKLGGAIYLSGASNMTLSDCNLQNNVARLAGGAIYGAAFNEILVNAESKLVNNRVINGQGDDIFVANTQNTLTLDTVEITNEFAKTSVYLDSASLVMSGGYMHDISQSDSLQGGAIQCYNCRSVLIEDMMFEDLWASRGGAIYFFENSNNKLEDDTYGKYVIKDSIFRRCEANQGGAIFLDDAQYVKIEGSYFYENKAMNNTDDSV